MALKSSCLLTASQDGGLIFALLMSPLFYTEESGGVPFVDWVKAMVENQGGTKGHGAIPWTNLECSNCETPEGVECE